MQEMGMGGQLWDRDSAMQEVAKGELGDDYGMHPCLSLQCMTSLLDGLLMACRM